MKEEGNKHLTLWQIENIIKQNVYFKVNICKVNVNVEYFSSVLAQSQYLFLFFVCNLHLNTLLNHNLLSLIHTLSSQLYKAGSPIIGYLLCQNFVTK